MEEQRPAKRVRTVEDSKRRARRTAIRLASAANRSHWQSLVELSITLLTGGESLVTQQQYTLFMSGLFDWIKVPSNGHTEDEEGLSELPFFDKEDEEE